METETQKVENDQECIHTNETVVSGFVWQAAYARAAVRLSPMTTFRGSLQC